MTGTCTIAETVDRLLTERLSWLMSELTARDSGMSGDTVAGLAQLVTAVSALREEHAVDARGRCGSCNNTRWPRRRQPCSVFAVLGFQLGHS